MPDLSRRGSRREILRAANRLRRRRGNPPLYVRHIQHAVHIARQNRLVSADVLRRAGYRA